MTLANIYARTVNASECWVCQYFSQAATSWRWQAYPLPLFDLISIAEQDNMGEIGEILANLVENTTIHQSRLCAPIGDPKTSDKSKTLSAHLIQVYDYLILKHQDNAKNTWPRVLYLEEVEIQPLQGGINGYTYIVVFGNSNCSKSQGEAGAKCTVVRPLTVSNSYRCIFRLVDSPWNSHLSVTSTICYYQNCSHSHYNSWHLPKYGNTDSNTQFALNVKSVGISSSWCFERNGAGGHSDQRLNLQSSKCNMTFLRITNATLIAPNGTHFVCGNKAYPFLPRGWRGRCYLAYVLPAVRVVSEDYVKHQIIMTRIRRSLSQTEKWLGRFVPFLGVTDLQTEVQALQEAFEATANSTLQSIANISVEVYAMRKVVLQNRMALDIMLASQGGACKVIGTECCSYIPDNSEGAVHILAQILHEQVAKINKDHGIFSSEWDTWFGSILGPIWNHLKAFVTIVVSGVLIILLLYITLKLFICCVKYTMLVRRHHIETRHSPFSNASMRHERQNDLSI